jgi:hypothetical protein
MADLLTVLDLKSRQNRDDYQALLDDLRRGHHAQLVIAQKEQAAMAHELRTTEETFVEGLGQRTMSVHPTIYWEMVRRYGRDCWRDKGFRTAMMRDEPGIRAYARSRKIHSSGAGARTGGRA